MAKWQAPVATLATIGLGVLLVVALAPSFDGFQSRDLAAEEKGKLRAVRLGSHQHQQQQQQSAQAEQPGGAPAVASATAAPDAAAVQRQGEPTAQQQVPEQQQQQQQQGQQLAAEAAGAAAAAATLGVQAGQLGSWRVLVGLIGRNVAHELPHILHNIKTLAKTASFARTHVMMVENDSGDDTVGVFNRWAQANPDLHGEVRQLPPGPQRFQKSLTVLAEARNVYLAALRSDPKFADIDWLLVVDTDMCQLWDFPEMTRITAKLAPHTQVLFANGGCGWYEELDGGKDLGKALPMKHPQAAPIYCDLFALRAAKTRRRFSMDGSKVWWKPGTCKGSPAANEGLPCKQLEGEAVVPVDAAFGGWGLYRADVLRGAGSTCEYNSAGGFDCEHVSLSQCLVEKANATQLIATGLLVDWEGCERPFPE